MRSEVIRFGGRHTRRVLCLVLPLLLIVSMLGACASNTGSGTKGSDLAAMDPADRFGPENYNAEIAVLSYEEILDVGDGVLYREIKSLETVIARSPEVILLAIVEPGQAAMHHIQSWLEQLAADEAGSALVLLASKDAKDSFLQSFTQEGWPSFYIVQGASVKLSLTGYSDENLLRLKRLIDELK